MGFIVFAGLIYYSALGRREMESSIEEIENPTSEKLIGRRKELLSQIADLDSRFEGGEISENDYRKTREKKKAKLIEIAHKSENW